MRRKLRIYLLNRHMKYHTCQHILNIKDNRLNPTSISILWHNNKYQFDNTIYLIVTYKNRQMCLLDILLGAEQHFNSIFTSYLHIIASICFINIAEILTVISYYMIIVSFIFSKESFIIRFNIADVIIDPYNSVTIAL